MSRVDPLIVVLAIGALIFAAERWLTQPDDVVRVRGDDVQRLAAQWRAQMGQPPADVELQSLVDEFVREEILVREAKQLGLDRDDVIIRRRLAQKLTFVTEDLAVLEPAGEAALQDFFERHQADYAVAATTTFSHVFFSADSRTDPAADAELAKAQIDATNWRSIGDPLLLRRTYAHVTAVEIEREFGADFRRALDELAEGQWLGPLTSDYGSHLVLVRSRAASAEAAFAAIRAKVAADYDAERRRAANERHFEELRSRYRVEVEQWEVEQ